MLETDARAELAAQFIPAGSRVLDLSDTTTLQPMLPTGCSYQGRDSVRCDRGAVCDIAGGDFPTQAAAQSDIIVMLGTLERVADLENLFTHLRFCKQDVILSYCATDLAGGGARAGFANALSFYDLALLFDRYGFRVECTAPVDAGQVLMRLTPTERLKPVAACSVAVISDSDTGTFGGRLGCRMINALLPGEADVHHLSFGDAGSGARQIRPGGARHRRQPVPAAARRRRARHRFARQSGDRNFRHAIPRADPAAGARPADRAARYLVRALRRTTC